MKKTLTKAMAMALAFILLFGSAAAGIGGFAQVLDTISVRASAEELKYCDLTYSVKNGEVTITGCDKNASGDLVIPDEIDGFPITRIKSSAFSGCSELTDLTVGKSVKSIGSNAFSGCDKLANIKLGDNITKIGDLAFFGTAFYNNEANWEGDELYIGDYLIVSENVSGDFVLKSNVKCISDGGLPLSVNLTSINVSEGNTVYHASGNCLIETESKRMILGCKSSIIPDDGSVKIIGSMAFHGGIGIVSMDRPNGCVDLKNIIIPDSVEKIEDAAFGFCFNLTNITIPDSVKDIGRDAFLECTELTSITIPDSVRYIGDGAFSNTAYIKTASNWEDNVLYIGNHLIEAKETLTGSYDIKPGIKTIAEGAFSYCPGLTSITIPNSITDINGYAFRGCSELTSVYYNGTTEERSNITIDSFNNEYLLNATWHYTDEVLDNAKINVKSDEVYKNSKVTVTATAENVPEGYYLAVYDSGNEPVAKGDNKAVNYEIPGKVASDKTLTVKVVDADNNTQKDGNGKDLTAEINIKVKTGFFDILIAFFRMIFGMNKVTIKP